MRLDGYRARQSLVGLSAHCANSYIPQHIRTYNMLHMRDVGISTFAKLRQLPIFLDIQYFNSRTFDWV